MGNINVNELNSYNTTKEIVDRIIEMSYTTYGRDEELFKIDYYNNNRLEGHYIRFQNTLEIKHPFDTLFSGAEKTYLSKMFKQNKSSNEACFEEDHRGQARLILYEMLLGYSKSLNDFLDKNYNLDITVVEDFKIILNDLDISNAVKKYINGVIAKGVLREAQAGKNSDFVIKQKKTNGNLETIIDKVRLNSLDSKYNNEEGDNGHNFLLEGVYADEITENYFVHDEDKEELIESDNIYRKILDNLDYILTDTQKNYLKAYLDNKEVEFLKNINDKYVKDYRSIYRTRIKKQIDTYLDKSVYAHKVDGRWEYKETLLVSLENILDRNNNRDRFDKLVDVLIKNEGTVIEHLLLYYLLDLDVACYKPIIRSLQGYISVSNRYLENEFNTVIDAIKDMYRFFSKHNNVSFNLDRNDTEKVIDKFMKEILWNEKEGLISHSRGEHKFKTIRQLREFLCNTLDKKILNKELNDVLNKYGYAINLTSSVINKVQCYRVYVKGYEPKIIKKNRDYKVIREFDLTKAQKKKIESYLDNKLTIKKLINTRKECKRLRLCDVRDLIEKELNVKRLKVEEVKMVLQQCNYNLDIKIGGHQENSVKLPAHKIDKIK